MSGIYDRVLSACRSRSRNAGRVRPLTKVDMTRYPVAGWRTAFLASHGFRIKVEGDRLFMVRHG